MGQAGEAIGAKGAVTSEEASMTDLCSWPWEGRFSPAHASRGSVAAIALAHVGAMIGIILIGAVVNLGSAVS